MTRQYKSRLAAIFAVSLLVAGAVWAAFDAATPKVDLAAWVPQGALLSIESPDLATLLKDWNAGAEAVCLCRQPARRWRSPPGDGRNTKLLRLV